MFTVALPTSDPNLRLVEPNPERDAHLAVEWLADPHGRYTLKMMGVPDAQNRATTHQEEFQRISEFLTLQNQLNWMLQYEDKVVGTVWVDLQVANDTPAPSIDIMIGDPSTRGRGVGIAAMRAVLDYLKDRGEIKVYARHLVINDASKTMLDKLGFAYDKEPYIDQDALEWQNRFLELR